MICQKKFHETIGKVENLVKKGKLKIAKIFRFQRLQYHYLVMYYQGYFSRISKFNQNAKDILQKGSKRTQFVN